nr:class D sortase [Virgibacillus alimentarius]
MNGLKYISYLLIIVGVIFLSVFGYQYYQNEQNTKNSLAEAQNRIAQGQENNEKDKGASSDTSDNNNNNSESLQVDDGEAFATLDIPKLGKTLPIVEGTDPDSLDKGIGHLSNSVLPGENEQIVLSGHRDTVFRNFDQIEVGDQFTVNMPGGSHTYEIRETEIVPEDDTSVIREMGEEALVVTTCYPFSYVGSAPDRFVTYAYPVD